jgi:peptide/nickel transport system permease protein
MNHTAAENIVLKSSSPSKIHIVSTKLWQLRMGLIGCVFIAILIVTALFAPLIAPHDPFSQDIMQRLLPPVWVEGGSTEHLLGTDHVGRDLLSRIIYGTKISLTVGLAAVLLRL